MQASSILSLHSRGRFVTLKKLFSKWVSTLGYGQERPEKSGFLMSLKTMLFAYFSSEMLCLSELRNALTLYKSL